MPTLTPLETVTAFMKLMEPLDYDNAVKLIAETCEYTNMPMGSVTGPAGVRAVLEPFFAPTLENEFRVLRSAVNGNTVFLERLDRHRLASGWVELPVNGVYEVENGKITVWRDYFDLATIMGKWPTA
jgi:limonene-1,2-epoxide hydrolase